MIIKSVFLIGLLSVFRRTQYITSIGLLYKNRDLTWKVSDFEELVGITHRREWSRYANKRFQKQEKHLRPCVGFRFISQNRSQSGLFL